MWEFNQKNSMITNKYGENNLERHYGKAYSGNPDKTLLKQQFNLIYALNYLKDNEEYTGMHYSTTSNFLFL